MPGSSKAQTHNRTSMCPGPMDDTLNVASRFTTAHAILQHTATGRSEQQTVTHEPSFHLCFLASLFRCLLASLLLVSSFPCLSLFILVYLTRSSVGPPSDMSPVNPDTLFVPKARAARQRPVNNQRRMTVIKANRGKRHTNDHTYVSSTQSKYSHQPARHS